MSHHHALDPLAPARPTARPRRQSHWERPAPAETVSHPAAGSEPAKFREPPIMAQARDIIDTVLSDPDPRLAEIQRCLRKKVAAHPGCPSRALLAHLLETHG